MQGTILYNLHINRILQNKLMNGVQDNPRLLIFLSECTGPLFSLTHTVYHFLPLFRRACGQLSEFVALVR
jgi:hypothetical protein